MGLGQFYLLDIASHDGYILSPIPAEMELPDEENTRDLELLRNDPQGLILHYQPMISIIVRIYVGSGMFLPEEIDDVRQTVNEHLLRKIPQIQRQYNGTAFVRTYVSAIVRNICRKVRRAKRRIPVHVPLEDPPDTDNQSNKYSIEYARRLLQTILKLYNHRNRLPKVLLCLKLRFRIALNANDILSWFPSCPESDLSMMLEQFGGEYGDMLESEVYAKFSPVLNKAEGKDLRGDSIRKWIQARINEILELLNGTPKRASFDEDTLKILIEDFFHPFLENEG